jgi:hypothetical protein
VSHPVPSLFHAPAQTSSDQSRAARCAISNLHRTMGLATTRTSGHSLRHSASELWLAKERDGVPGPRRSRSASNNKTAHCQKVSTLWPIRSANISQAQSRTTTNAHYKTTYNKRQYYQMKWRRRHMDVSAPRWQTFCTLAIRKKSPPTNAPHGLQPSFPMLINSIDYKGSF